VSRMSMAQAIRAALDYEMTRDGRVIVIGEDVSHGIMGVTSGLIEAHGAARVIDTPISESAFLTAAVGAAVTGLRPVAELMFCDFLGVGFDALLNQASKQRFLAGGRSAVPLTLRTTVGAGDSSAAQHSQSLQHIFASIPGLKCAMPADAADAMGLTVAAIRDPDPVVLLENKLLYDSEAAAPGLPEPIPLGRAKVLREGGDATLVATGRMVHFAAEAAETLAEEGAAIELIDPRSLYPLDVETIRTSVEKTGRLVVAEEGAAHCGLAAEIAAQVTCAAFSALRAAPVLLTPPHTPVPFSPPLEAAWLPGAETIAAGLRQALTS